MTDQASAYWLRAPGHGEIRTERLRAPGEDEVLVRTVRTGLSRGTEALVHRGGVPKDQYDRMRAPFQEGDLPGPVKYGYLNVGVVEAGRADLVGRTVFCLYPHQTAYVVPADAVAVVPEDVPVDRAVLAGTMETALNAVWEAQPLPGDRVAVVGAGLVGCCLARLLARMPALEVTLVDIDPSRRSLADALGTGFATPVEAPAGRDLTFHASATGEGLQTALDLLAPDGAVVELSWYGDRTVELALGGAFHAGRLRIIASQVGEVALPRRTRRSRADRLALALELLRDPALDALLAGSSPFADLPAVMDRLGQGTLPGPLHTITYAEGAV